MNQRRLHQLLGLVAAHALPVAVSAFAVSGCGDPFSSCEAHRSCPHGGSGGAGGVGGGRSSGGIGGAVAGDGAASGFVGASGGAGDAGGGPDSSGASDEEGGASASGATGEGGVTGDQPGGSSSGGTDAGSSSGGTDAGGESSGGTSSGGTETGGNSSGGMSSGGASTGGQSTGGAGTGGAPSNGCTNKGAPACGGCLAWDFESGSDPAPWVREFPSFYTGPNGATNLAITATERHGGSSALVAPVSIGTADRAIALVAATTSCSINLAGYSMSAWVFLAGPALTVWNSAIFIHTWGPSGAGDRSGQYWGSIPTGRWFEVTISFASPTSVNRIGIELVPNTDWTGTMYVDDVVLTGL